MGILTDMSNKTQVTRFLNFGALQLWKTFLVCGLKECLLLSLFLWKITALKEIFVV